MMRPMHEWSGAARLVFIVIATAVIVGLVSWIGAQEYNVQFVRGAVSMPGDCPTAADAIEFPGNEEPNHGYLLADDEPTRAYFRETDDWTLCAAMIFPTGTNSDQVMISQWEFNGDDYQFYLRRNDGDQLITLRNNNFVTTSSAFVADTWYMVCSAHDEATNTVTHWAYDIADSCTQDATGSTTMTNPDQVVFPDFMIGGMWTNESTGDINQPFGGCMAYVLYLEGVTWGTSDVAAYCNDPCTEADADDANAFGFWVMDGVDDLADSSSAGNDLTKVENGTASFSTCSSGPYD